ncbi:hypothetical protein [Amycolatopsis sp. FDAARGOS 1241]|uniref:hypothetical protein n=1 Tax=Amycolatopsis sp. FDAARGOS 1241 TaxID=2778070 RepID=UPI00195103F4|nr:hypothetical protein [Amycolatopsis sp. FDAARGOS 1241]QRP50135.1 hypothetical protein I6J71_21970 [Amycolatopsis sp. FDAARGOS 1241]
MALDIIALMEALHLDKAVFGGYDGGVRAADVVSVLGPKRVKAMVAVSGYGVDDLKANKEALPPAAEYG